MDKPRWQDLNDLIEYSRRVAKEKLTNELVERLLADETSDDARRLLAQRVRTRFKDGKLELSQYEMLMRLIREDVSQHVSP